MRPQRSALPLWASEGVHQARDLDTLFASELDRLPPIHDRHGCVFWIGPIAQFIELPSVGVSSYDLLFHADREAFMGVHREALRELKVRGPEATTAASQSAGGKSEDGSAGAISEANDRAMDPEFEAFYRIVLECGRALPLAAAAFRQIEGFPEPGCFGLLRPEYRGTLERQILRSLGLTVDEARTKLAGKKLATAPLDD